MANYKVTDSELSGIASAIRLKGGTSDPLVFPSGFVSAISAIETGGEPPVLVSKIITSNGEYDPASDNADAYSHVVVNVSGGGGGLDDFVLTGESGYFSNSTASLLRTYALASHVGLSGIHMQSVKTIGNDALTWCTNLSEAIFEECTSIGNNALARCNKLKNISFPKCVSIGYRAFYIDQELMEVSFPLCTTMSSEAFIDCEKLSKAYFPVASFIPQKVFESCYSLQTVLFPEATVVSANAFSNAFLLQSIELPECSSIAQSAFYNCRSLSTVSLPKCKMIGAYAFGNCSKLESVYLLADSVCSIGYGLDSTPMKNSTYLGYFGSIYVPASLLTAYQESFASLSERFVAFE